MARVNERNELGHAEEFNGLINVLRISYKSHHLRLLLVVHLRRYDACEKIFLKPFLKPNYLRIILLLLVITGYYFWQLGSIFSGSAILIWRITAVLLLLLLTIGWRIFGPNWHSCYFVAFLLIVKTFLAAAFLPINHRFRVSCYLKL
mgnify:CR=1 FL=1